MGKIAFVRVFASHPILVSVEDMLKRSFPEYELETITITELLKKRPDLLAFNSLDVMRVYYREILKNPRTFTRRFLRTPFMFQQVRRLVRHHIERNRGEYSFSFQLQSLFDASTPGLPHFIYTDHTYQESQRYEYRNAPYSTTWLKLEKEIYQNADRIFTRSSNISNSLIIDYGIPQSKVVCAYTGSNILKKDGSGDEHDYSKKNILFVGIDWERKGGPALLEAFRIVLNTVPDAQLNIIGPDVQVDLPNCRVLGQIPIEQLDQYYRQASIFCLPTRREPFGIVFIEALQYALPIVATGVGALPDFVKVGENGYLVEPEDVPALAYALIDLLQDEEKRRRFGRNSYILWKERYNWENVGAIIRREILEVV